MSSLVSIIMPVYNGERYLSEAIRSVLDQTYTKWELLIINDGSDDRSKEVIMSFDDQRIKYFEQENKGVSAARNVGLNYMQGEYLCFLDADDVFPPESLSVRMALFGNDPKLRYVDGGIIFTDSTLTPTGRKAFPSYRGLPLSKLLRLDSSCFFGNTWMIKKVDGLHYEFNESMSHSEDVLFYLSICHQQNGYYCYVNHPILYYRQLGTSAMSNLGGLEKGYISLISEVREMGIGNRLNRFILKLKCIKIMFLSYLFDGKDVGNAFLSIIRIARV
ncbi:glycosyltransferase family 2 protein [Ekhidna sp.]|uniref:glycosyltransferase family 2 protein n=1 Tax=Ekhidna sp. TaxID=2608089 RepID=UPI003CCB784B